MICALALVALFLIPWVPAPARAATPSASLEAAQARAAQISRFAPAHARLVDWGHGDWDRGGWRGGWNRGGWDDDDDGGMFFGSPYYGYATPYYPPYYYNYGPSFGFGFSF